jgi:hypothetical protein
MWRPASHNRTLTLYGLASVAGGIIPTMKNSIPAAALASLSIAAPSIPAVESASNECESVEITQCATRDRTQPTIETWNSNL